MMTLGPFEKAVVVIRPHPKLFHLNSCNNASTNNSTGDPRSLFNIDYRLILAVGTQDCIIIYDLCRVTPIAMIKDMHCATLTDLAWSPDGLSLLVSSSDGYCSIIMFEEGELGTFLSVEEQATLIARNYCPKEKQCSNNITEGIQNTPLLLPDVSKVDIHMVDTPSSQPSYSIEIDLPACASTSRTESTLLLS